MDTPIDRAYAGLRRGYWLGQHEALAFWFGNGISEFVGGVDPQLNSLVGIGECGFRRAAAGHATRQFRRFGNEDLVLIAPINDDLVFVRAYSFPPSSPYRSRARRIRTAQPVSPVV